MDLKKLESFVAGQKVAFICSVDGEGFPNVKAMLRPRKIDSFKDFYFSTNTSSMRVKQYLENPKASIYFYHKGLIRYEGVMLKGTMEVLTDQKSKDMIWRRGDSLFYKGGVTDPDYCVIRITVRKIRYYSNFKSVDYSVQDPGILAILA